MSFDGKVAIVTGASRGLGKASAIVLARNGAKVACIARDTEKLAETVAEATEIGGQVEAFACDVHDRKSVDALVDRIAAQWKRLDILVNNAGVTRDTLLPRMSDEQWDEVIDVDLTGSFNSIQAVVDHMMQRGSGSIVNVSSVSGIYGNVGQVNYSAAKAGESEPWNGSRCARTWAPSRRYHIAEPSDDLLPLIRYRAADRAGDSIRAEGGCKAGPGGARPSRRPRPADVRE